MDAIFLDFAKAFDKVSHPHRLLKLQHYGIKRMDFRFLDYKNTRVVIDGHSSGWSEVTSGGPRVKEVFWDPCSFLFILTTFL